MCKKLFFIICIFFSLSTFSQTFVSKKQIVFDEFHNEITSLTKKSIIIKDTLVTLELPNENIFNGVIYLYDEVVDKNNFKSKIYKINGGGVLTIGFDNIFVNFSAVNNNAYVFYLENYIEPTKEEKEKIATEKLKKKEELELKLLEKISAKLNEEFDDFTVNCIINKRVKVGMEEKDISLILGRANSINTTETEKTISKQYVYDTSYIYTENGFVTTIQYSK